jgi:HAD superfamily hydrolase (TIGR01450 family)
LAQAASEAPGAYLLDLDGTLYAGGGAVPGAPQALQRLRGRGIPFRLVTNTTSRSRSMLVHRLAGYGFEVATEEVFTATIAGAQLAHSAGHTCVAPYVLEPALEDLQGFDLIGGISRLRGSRPPDAILVGDLGDRWTYSLMQEAFEYLMAGAAFIALSRDRYWLRDGRLALDAGPFVVGLEFASGKSAAIAGKPSPCFIRLHCRVSAPPGHRPPWSGMISGPTSKAPSAPVFRAGWSAPASTGNPFCATAAFNLTVSSTASLHWSKNNRLIFPNVALLFSTRSPVAITAPSAGRRVAWAIPAQCPEHPRYRQASRFCSGDPPRPAAAA